MIGLTVVSLGTSAPELVVSLISTSQGNLGQAGAGNLAVSNIVGSNMFNVLVVLGLSAAVSGPRGLGVDAVMIQRDLPIFWWRSTGCIWRSRCC